MNGESLIGNVYGQYATRIVQGILFHSVPYLRSDKSTLKYEEYDKLGTTASEGCIRLTVEDAKWIYDNCDKGTLVEFYGDENPGPLGKPTAKKLSNEDEKYRCWDPTDPDNKNPWLSGMVETDPDEIISERCRVNIKQKNTKISIREQPSLSADIVAQLFDGDVVTRIERRVANQDNYIWDKVKLSDGTIGYVITQCLDLEQENAQTYNISQLVGNPVSVEDDKELECNLQDGKVIIGPVNITKNNNISNDVTFDIKSNGVEVSDFKILDYKKEEISDNSELSKGGEFYISLQQNNLKNLTVNMVVNYETTTMNLIDSETDNDYQLAVEMQKSERRETTKLAVKELDLALRKYIIKIGDTVINDRIPDIDKNTLQNETTATYKHKKNAIEVQTGSEVIYNITVYNEGALAGKAIEITDQLPTGVEFVEVLTDNYEVKEYNKTTNRLVLKGKNLRDLAGYSGGDLDSETVRIKCKVTAEADTSKDKVLTNVAWISEAISTDGIIVDRDSEPEITPQVNKDSMEDYVGDQSNKNVDLNQAEYYFKGEQDEDDFEKLVIIKKEPTSTPTPMPTEELTPTPTPTPTEEPTPTPTPTPTEEPTSTPTPTPSPVVSSSPSPQPSASKNTATIPLPKAGTATIVLVSIAILGFAIYLFIKYIRLKNEMKH